MSKPDHESSHEKTDFEVALELKHKKEEQNEKELFEHIKEQILQEREKDEEEYRKRKELAEQRKQKRDEEERQLAAERAERERIMKEEQEQKKLERQEAQQKRREAQEQKRREEEERRSKIGKPNFVIVKKTKPEEVKKEEPANEDMAKSKEQLEAEKKAILSQRIQPLDIAGFDTAKLAEKAKEIHSQIWNLECERYDLEQRFKKQQLDMMELGERARQMNKGDQKPGAGGRLQQFDRLSDKYSQAPPKVMMFSKYERQTDLRKFGERQSMFQEKKEPAAEKAAAEAPAEEE